MAFQQTEEKELNKCGKNRSEGPEIAFEETKQDASEVSWRQHRVQAHQPAL